MEVVVATEWREWNGMESTQDIHEMDDIGTIFE